MAELQSFDLIIIVAAVRMSVLHVMIVTPVTFLGHLLQLIVI